MVNRIAAAAFVVTLLLVEIASAQFRDPVDVFVSGHIGMGSSPFLTVGERVRLASPGEVDYAVFLHELVAFVTKEVLPDADDEYAHSSDIPSALTHGSDLDFRLPPSRFGAHCLIVLRQMGASLAPGSGSALLGHASPTLITYFMRTATTALALEQIWSMFRNHASGDTRSRLSLDPKVSAHKIGAYLTIRW